jgi:hypothetical protein
VDRLPRTAVWRPDSYGASYAMSACCMAPLDNNNSRLAVLETVKTMADADKLGLDRLVGLALAAAWAATATNSANASRNTCCPFSPHISHLENSQ